MVIFVVGFPDHDIQEHPLFGIQDLVWLGHHLLVPPYHAPCPAVPMTPYWLEVIGQLLHLLNHQHYKKVLVNIHIFWLE